MKGIRTLCAALLAAGLTLAEGSVETTFTCYPVLYATMGTPLYETLERYALYNDLEGMSEEHRIYREQMLPIYRHGMALSTQNNLSPSERTAYLGELRNLETAKKKIMHALTEQTMQAIDTDNFETFERLIELPLEELLPTLTTRTKAIDYYQQHRKIPIDSLDTLAAEELKRRKLKRMRPKSFQYESGPRDYRLMQHLPDKQESIASSCPENPNPAVASDDSNLSTLKAVGNVFKSMGINFDPALMQEYRTHTPPSVEDFR